MTSHTTRPVTTGRRHRLLRPKWALIVAVLAMFIAVLVTNGLVSSQIGNDAIGARAAGPDVAVPAAVKDGGPVVDLTRGRSASMVLPPRTVALTFDDGPDPQWTPAVLAVLAKHGVQATFFVVGSRVARYPELVRQIRASGSEIGLHSFTHPDLGVVSPGRVDREFAGTQLVLAWATGESSYLVRPPYGSEVQAVDDAGYRVLQQLGRDGYVTALVDVDSQDWQRPGVDAIVANVLPAGGPGGVVLLHDAGVDRSETVAALDRIIPILQARGVTFTTVSRGVGLPAADYPADPVRSAWGGLVVAAVGTAGAVVTALEWSLLIGGGLVIGRLLLMIVVAARHGRRRRHAAPRWQCPVSVVVPAYNEDGTIAATVASLVASDHPVEVIVVDDGSTDGTAATVERMGAKGVRVIRQPNEGKPAALNAGIAAASHDVIVMMDGDTIFEPTTVGNLAARFADPRVGAVAGNARVADRHSLIAKWQHIEYVIGFNIDRRVQDTWGVITTVPGAVGAFRRAALLEVGGVSADTLAEDTDLTIALGRAGWRVVYEPTARAWTDAPATFAQLWRQRYRWSYGIMQSLWKHRRAVFERGASGHIGRVGLLTTALFQVVLPLLAPMVDVYLVYGLVFLEPLRTAAIWGAALAVQTAAGVVAFRLEGEPLRGIALLPLQQLVYRQLMYAVLIQSVASAVSGSRLLWQKIPRAGRFSAARLGADARAMNPTPRRFAGLVPALLAAAVAVGCAATAPTGVTAQAPSATARPSGPATDLPQATGTALVTVTFYGGPDNDPPGSAEISHPNARHTAAGGTGTAADPITLATAPRELPLGRTVYIPWLQKYFVMEDDCATCTDEWSRGLAHIDLWTAPAGDALQACEQALTPAAPVVVEVNPPPDRPVDPRLLYDDTTGACWPAT